MPIQKNNQYYADLGLATLKELETDEGILASSKEEVYGCIFGRDSLITCLKLLRVYKKTNDKSLLLSVKKCLKTLVRLQGKEVNIESGEEPGKCIHEYRPHGHEHLTKTMEKPWYLYKDSVLRNYDSVDATSLFLITFYRYWQYSKDEEFLKASMPNVEAALDWCFNFGDSNGDGLIDYEINKNRTHGGLINQNWMDSQESVFHETDGVLTYPLAPVEAQAYTYLAYRLWATFFTEVKPEKNHLLLSKAWELKKLFNHFYVTTDPNGQVFLSAKIDGEGKPFRSVRSNMGHVLWASLNKADDGELDCILDPKYIPAIVERLMKGDIFEPEAGIRTLSMYSRNYQPNSYHNGSIWPHDNAMIAEGFEIHGYKKEAERIKKALFNALGHFETAIELFVYNGNFTDWVGINGQRSCKKQAWSAAGMLDLATT